MVVVDVVVTGSEVVVDVVVDVEVVVEVVEVVVVVAGVGGTIRLNSGAMKYSLAA